MVLSTYLCLLVHFVFPQISAVIHASFIVWEITIKMSWLTGKMDKNSWSVSMECYSLQLSQGRRNLLTTLQHPRNSKTEMARIPWVSWQVTGCGDLGFALLTPVLTILWWVVAVKGSPPFPPSLLCHVVYLASSEPCLINQPAFLLWAGNSFLQSLTQTLDFR